MEIDAVDARDVILRKLALLVLMERSLEGDEVALEDVTRSAWCCGEKE